MCENSTKSKPCEDFTISEATPPLTRKEYREILLARMAGGDLYANEDRMKIRKIDSILDYFRDKPLYPENRKTDS